MSATLYRALLIASAGLLGGLFGLVGAVLGLFLLMEVLGIYVGPEPRLVIAAAGLFVWTGVGGMTAAWGLDHDRPVRGTWANGAAFLRRSIAGLAAGTNPARLRRRLKRLTWAAAAFWLLAGATAIGAAYFQHVILGEGLSYRLAFGVYGLEPDWPFLQSMSDQQRRDDAVAMARGGQRENEFVFRLVTASIIFAVGAAFLTLATVRTSGRLAVAEIRAELAARAEKGSPLATSLSLGS